jgi:hypothetical protein
MAARERRPGGVDLEPRSPQLFRTGVNAMGWLLTTELGEKRLGFRGLVVLPTTKDRSIFNESVGRRLR